MTALIRKILAERAASNTKPDELDESTGKQIIAKGHDGMYKLVHDKTDEIAKVGDEVTDFRGNKSTLKGGAAPHKPSSSGYATTDAGHFYAGVNNLTWKKHVANESEELSEAVSPHKVGDAVHVGSSALHGESGTVTKTTGHGHTHVTTASGKQYKFNSRGVSDNQHISVHTAAAHAAAVKSAAQDATRAKEAQENLDRVAKAHSEANDADHKTIIDKLRAHSDDPHLAKLGNPTHKIDRHGNYNGSITKSHVDAGHFGDLFHKVTKNVRIHNASPDEKEKYGITHHGEISYDYSHPGGGSNGHHAADFTCHTDGSIKIKKDVHTGSDQFSDHFERKVVKHIK